MNEKKNSKLWRMYLFIIIGFTIILLSIVFRYKSEILLYQEQINEYENQISKDEEDFHKVENIKNSISDQVYNNLEQLSMLIDYTIEKYCEKAEIKDIYQYNVIDNMLHYQTRIVEDNYYCFDLAKEINPELSNRKFFYKVNGKDNDLIIVIDTFRMKILVYTDNRDDNLTVIEGEMYDSEAFTNWEFEDCVISDWDDPFIGEYWGFAYEGWEKLKIPENIAPDQELYGRVIYALKRYCEENQISENFSFDVDTDIISAVTNMVFTIKLKGENRILYMDLDCRRNKFHVYEVEY